MLLANVIGALPLLFIPYLASAALVNRTIDDTAGDSVTGLKPVYFPSPSSVRMWKSHPCPVNDCSTRPDISRTFGNSYTAATFRSQQSSKMSITLRFTGTAVYTFFLLVNYAGRAGVISRTDCKFVLDNGPAVSFSHTPDRSKDDILYNQLVFSQTGLPNTEHTLEIVTEDLTYQTYVNFDYAIYTFDDGVETSSLSGQPTTPGAGTSATKSAPDTRIQTVAGQSIIAIQSTTTVIIGGLRGSDLATAATIFLPEPSDPAPGASNHFDDGAGASVSARVSSEGTSHHRIEARTAGLGLLSSFILLPAAFLVN